MSAAESSTESSARTGGVSFTGRRLVRPCVALVVAVASVVGAYSQSPRPDVWEEPAPWQWSWWAYPIERNAFLRQSVLQGSVRRLVYAEEAGTLWVIGDDALLAYSDDGGRSWNAVDVSAAVAAFDSGAEPRPIGAAPESARIGGWARAAFAFDGEEPTGKEPVGKGGEPARSTSTATPEPTESPGPTASPTPSIAPPPLDTSAPTGLELNDLWMRDDGREGLIVGDRGLILRTSDSGRSWSRVTAPARDSIRSIAMARGGDLGWAVGDAGLMLGTKDGGRSWRGAVVPSNGDLSAVACSEDMNLCWAVGETIVLVRMGRSQGSPWTRADDAAQDVLLPTDVAVSRTGSHVWIVGWEGVRWSEDRGRTWRRQSLEGLEEWRRTPHRIVLSVDGTAAMILTSLTGVFLRIESEGLRELWSPAFAGAGAPFSANDILSIDHDGAVHRWRADVDEGETTTPIIPVTSVYTHSVQGADVFFMHTNGSSFVVSFDGGRTWSLLPGGGALALELERQGTAGEIAADDHGEGGTGAIPVFGASVARSVDGTRAVLVGDDRQILYSNDGGQTWDPVLYAQVAPAPWFFVVIFGCLLFGFVGSPRSQAPTLAADAPADPEASIAPMAASDRPLRPGDPDPLGVGPLAAGVARFLANSATEPPLTIAVTGDWGTGKSSIMNLIRAELARYGFHGVWFNAWHHQTEEHLLASLSESIRRALPWVRRGGFGFRIRLFWRRTRNHWIGLLALVTATVAALGLWFRAGNGLSIEALGSGASLDTSTVLLSLLGGLIVIPAWVFSLLRGGTTFGVSANRLYAWLVGHVHVSRLQASTGLRHDFAESFREVTEALKSPDRPCGLVLFIDDLDRCRHENVVQVLEMVNFLVTSGDCYIVLGMAPRQVEGCVGLGFKDVAKQLADPSDGGDAQNEERRILDNYARKYLEKLVNLAVPVPTLDAAGTSGLLAASVARLPPREANQPEATGLQRVWRELGRMVVRHADRLPAITEVVALGLILAALWQPPSEGIRRTAMVQPLPAGAEPRSVPTPVVLREEIDGRLLASLVPVLRRGSAEEREDARLTLQLLYPERAGRILAAIHPTEESGAHTGIDEPDDGTPGEEYEQTPRRPGGVFGGQVDSLSPWWGASLLLFVLVALARWTRDEPLAPERDSTRFVAALERWNDIIHERTGTPRGVKRFVNRLRYYAMRQRGIETRLTRRERLFVRMGWLEVPPPTMAGGRRVIPEDVLVALGAQEMAAQAGRDSEVRIAATVAELRERHGAAAWNGFEEEFRRLARGSRIA